MGQSNAYRGHLYGYEPVWGTGQALLRLDPVSAEAGDLEYDEDDVEMHHGDREVLAK